MQRRAGRGKGRGFHSAISLTAETAVVFAPADSSIFSTSRWPCSAAVCSGVRPDCSHLSTSQWAHVVKAVQPSTMYATPLLPESIKMQFMLADYDMSAKPYAERSTALVARERWRWRSPPSHTAAAQ